MPTPAAATVRRTRRGWRDLLVLEEVGSGQQWMVWGEALYRELEGCVGNECSSLVAVKGDRRRRGMGHTQMGGRHRGCC